MSFKKVDFFFSLSSGVLLHHLGYYCGYKLHYRHVTNVTISKRAHREKEFSGNCCVKQISPSLSLPKTSDPTNNGIIPSQEILLIEEVLKFKFFS